MTDAAPHGEPPPRADAALLAAALGALAGSAKVDALIERQIALADLQIEDIRRDDKLRRSSLRYAHASTVMKVMFELALALLVVAIAIVTLSAVWSAHEANGLVIESFAVPQSLAERGLTGQVVASRLLDKLSGLQAQTDSLRAPSSYANNWGDDIKVLIPDTGVSIGEFNRYLRQWLGHETQITGEVWRTGTGIAVVARAGADEGAVFAGGESDLDALLQQAAESIYEKTQPYRYAVYLFTMRRDEAKASSVLAHLVSVSAPAEQAWAYAMWSNADFTSGDWAGAFDKTSRAIALDPNNALAPENRGEGEREVGREETALADFKKALQLSQSGRADINPVKLGVAIRFSHVNIGQKTGAFLDDIAMLDEIERLPSYSLSAGTSPSIKLIDYGWLHDDAALARQFARAKAVTGNDTGLAYYLWTAALQGRAAAGDWQGALQAHAVLEGMAKTSPLLRLMYLPTQGSAWQALTLAGEGRFDEARAAIASTPRECDLCLRVRGEIAAMEKRWGAAAYWFALDTRAAPSIPLGWSNWARMLLDKGDAAGAVEKARAARDLGPHFADPLEIWGEALMAQDRSGLALAKFAEAAQYAPHWGRLHLKWGEALWWSGQKDEARKQFAAAAGLELAPSEKSELARFRGIHV
ncbi:MAG: hypothetical protein ACREHE_11550 [Rhizomicrobium sp.]